VQFKKEVRMTYHVKHPVLTFEALALVSFCFVANMALYVLRYLAASDIWMT